MNIINVNAKTKKYNIYQSGSFMELEGCLASDLKSRKALIVTDSNVAPIYLAETLKSFENAGINVYYVVLNAGETNKNFSSVEKIYNACIDAGIDRSGAIAALGGGVVGDLAGFAAATFMRGVSFVQIPTTLLAMVDSSVGGKTGYDFCGYKNLVGAFYQPEFVYINHNVLKTLPEREVKAGYAEVIKYGIIYDSDFFSYLLYNTEKILSLDGEALLKTIGVCCDIKRDVVEKDEKEASLRAILNFGHTIGHAIESASDFSLLHGECVALGMLAACKIQQLLNPDFSFDDVSNIIKASNLPCKAAGINKNLVLLNLKKDKKQENGSIKFVLPERIGEVYIIKNVPSDVLEAAVDFVLEEI